VTSQRRDASQDVEAAAAVSVIIPIYPGHFDVLSCTLWTWEAHLLDAELVHFYLVAYSDAELHELRRVLRAAGHLTGATHIECAGSGSRPAHP